MSRHLAWAAGGAVFVLAPRYSCLRRGAHEHKPACCQYRSHAWVLGVLDDRATDYSSVPQQHLDVSWVVFSWTSPARECYHVREWGFHSDSWMG
jgi:hypothetical protein